MSCSMSAEHLPAFVEFLDKRGKEYTLHPTSRKKVLTMTFPNLANPKKELKKIGKERLNAHEPLASLMFSFLYERERANDPSE